jgi:hypothetical protein
VALKKLSIFNTISQTENIVYGLNRAYLSIFDALKEMGG